MNANQKDSRGFLAIVSPCSTCKNKNPFPTDDNKSFCPRLHWIEVKKAMEASTDKDTVNNAQYLRHLALTGNEGGDSPDALRNPVPDTDGDSTLIWVANIQDNEETRDNQGQITNPSILSGPDKFQTDHIVCSSLPYVPESSATEYNQTGRLEEWTPVLATNLTQQVQEETDSNAHYGGTVKRTSFLYKLGKVFLNDHQCPEGQ